MRARQARATLLAGTALVAALALAAPVSAHPLGNFTINRGISVVVMTDSVSVRYVFDLAEIPAFSAIERMDADADGSLTDAEKAAYAQATCLAASAGLLLVVDGEPSVLTPDGDPTLSFPPGAGGLETLRLVCQSRAELHLAGGEHELSIADRIDDGHIGWHEVTIGAGNGVDLVASDVPARSPSGLLTSYPVASLDAPLNVRRGSATYRLDASGIATIVDQEPAKGAPRSSAADPLAALAAADLTPPAIGLGLLLAAALGAIHAVSPGHGKTLVAAYLIGSRGSLRQAAGLGLTVAATHTAGVFLLGLVTLAAGEFFVPERVIGWLSAASGVLVVLLGLGLIVQAARSRAAAHRHARELSHERAYDHPHPHPHAGRPAGPLRAQNIVALGLAGGMVPSASALIVLLVALTTGRLVLGLALIVAFGGGMALVLGGLAMATTLLGRVVANRTAPAGHRWIRTAMAWVPLASGVAVTSAGVAVTLAAIARFA